jgi:flagellar basal-body rod modification protein FlgD
VQFTSVEQQLKTNDFLQAMVLNSQNAAATQAVGYIGKDVTASGVKTELKDGKATWMFNLARAADKVTVTVKDSDGNVVYTQQAKMEAGGGQFSWNGVGSDGSTEPNGSYSIQIDARDAEGAYVPTTTEMTGNVTGVDLTGSEPVLLVGSARINLSTVTSVRTPAS